MILGLFVQASIFDIYEYRVRSRFLSSGIFNERKCMISIYLDMNPSRLLSHLYIV